MTVDDFDTACVFVELGLGYTLVPAIQAANFSRSARVTSVPVIGLGPLPIGLAARRWSSMPEAANHFVDVFKTQLKTMAKMPGVALVPG